MAVDDDDDNDDDDDDDDDDDHGRDEFLNTILDVLAEESKEMLRMRLKSYGR